MSNWKFPYCPESGAPLDWEGLDAAFPWVRALKDVPQEPRWHAEGDVWIHTKMVLEALLALPEFQALPEGDRQIVFTATLLHDVAKPATTITDTDGVIRSPKHSVIGEKIARQILWKGDVENGLEPCPLPMRERICELVRYHGLPLNFKFDDFSQKRIRKVSHLTDLKLLAMLAKADVIGRECEDKESALDRPEFFAEFAKELDCWNGPFPFADALSRYDYFRKEDGNAFYQAFDDRKFEMVLMSGLPGSGKDTWIKKHLPDWPVVSLDALRTEMGVSPKDNQGIVIQEARERARVHMRAGQNFIWNATNLTRDLRQKTLNLVAEYNGKPRIVYIEQDYETVFRQNRGREEHEVVPQNVMERMIKMLEVPEVWEAAAVTYVTG